MARFKGTKKTKQAIYNSSKYGLQTYFYDYSKTPEQNYRRLAKVADQRLVRLESYAHDKGYKEVKNFAYNRALSDINNWTKGGKRFNTRPPKNQHQMIAKINNILTFLNSPTSTKKGVELTYKQKAKALSSNPEFQGLDITWKDLATLSEMGMLDWNDTMSSASFFRSLGKFQMNYDELRKKIEKNNPQAHLKKRVSKKELVEYYSRLLSDGTIKLGDIL